MSLRRDLKRFFSIFFVLLLGQSFSVHADAQEIFSAFIILNDQVLENPVWLEYNADDELQSLVHTSEIVTELREIFSEKVYKKIEAKTDDEKRITFKSLNEVGVRTDLDLQSLNLALNVDIEDKKLTEVLVSNQKRREDIVDLYNTSPFSGYFNFRSSVDFLGQGGGSTNTTDSFNRTGQLQAESVINIRGLVFESQYIYTNNQDEDIKSWRRVNSRAVYDFQKNAQRLTVGDLTETSRGFQTIGFGLGVNFRKEFTIQPNLFRSSFKRHKFFLESDSKVEIFVNGRLVKKLFLKQGPVELSDFPFISGENEVQVRVTDAFGNIRNIGYSDINDSRILPKGFSDYSFSLLFPRDIENLLSVDFGDDVYDYSNYNLNGFYHYGLFDDGTVGVDWQYSQRRYLLGVESIYGREEGLAKINIARSDNTDLGLSGFATRLEYENLLFTNGTLSEFNFLAGLEFRDRGFTTLDSIGAEDTKFIFSTSVGQNFRNSVRGSLGFSKEWGYVNSSQRNFLTSNFGWTLFRNFDFAANIRYNLNDAEDSTVLLSLNWYSKSNNQQSTSTYDPINDSISSEYVSFPIENRQNFRTSVGGELNQGSERASVGLDYFNQRADYRLAHSSAFLDSGNRAQSTQLSFGTGIAFTNTAIAITRPVDNAFVLVSMPERPRGHSIPIGRGIGSQRGEINRFGPASVTNLAPYFTDRINLDVAELPYGYTLKNEIFSFYPTYRGGVHIKVDVEGEVSISGFAVLENDEPAAYVTGNVYLQGEDGKRGELSGQFFTGGGGDFIVERLSKGNYILVFENEEGEYREVIVPVDKTIGVHQIKDVLKLVEP